MDQINNPILRSLLYWNDAVDDGSNFEPAKAALHDADQQQGRMSLSRCDEANRRAPPSSPSRKDDAATRQPIANEPYQLPLMVMPRQ